MSEKDLDTRFREAVEIASHMTQAELPQDVQLRLYAYYKHATAGNVDYNNVNFDLRNAFKTNAWMQISHLSVDEAKEAYINLIISLQKK
ncbi:acyl-CoA-binding protein [Flavobacterium sp. 3HN19-14]|uniref:acyl-CoA-binding protein n=1 Tax=Flavobacterium sp. 3HN19-14 TaxID=3448133 RepID=UPI003EE42055